MRKRYKVFVVIAIIVVSVYFGLTRSNLIDIVSAERNNIVDLTPVNKDFDMLPNFTKYSFYINANSDPATLTELDNILYGAYDVIEEDCDSATVKTVTPIIKKKYNLSNQVVAFNVIVPGGIGEEVLEKLREIPGYTNFEVSVDELPFTINVDQQIENRRQAIEDLTAKRGSSGFFSQVMDINNDINRMQNEIDSLRFEEDRYQQRMLNPALKIIVSNVGVGQVSMAKLVIEFFKNFVISFLALMLLLLIIYLALAFILRLMSYLGIRTAKSSGSGYGGYYKYNSRSGYGSYGGRYGSYGRRRKVKRVYKNRDEGETPESDKK